MAVLRRRFYASAPTASAPNASAPMAVAPMATASPRRAADARPRRWYRDLSRYGRLPLSVTAHSVLNKGTLPVPLSAMARRIIAGVPIMDGDPHKAADHVFSVNGCTPFDGWSKAKHRLDQRLLVALQAEGPSWPEIRPRWSCSHGT